MNTIYGFNLNRGHVVWLDLDKCVIFFLVGRIWECEEKTRFTAEEYARNMRTIYNYGNR